jgi:ketosteroid isomerase-like protein
MSQENVEIVKRFIPPPGSDYTELFGNDAAWAALKESVEPVVTPDFEGAFVALGQRMQFTALEGMRQGILEWVTPWASYYDEIEDVFGVRDDRVVVLGRQHGYRLDTEAEVVAESAGVYLLRNGKIARVDLYVDRAEALEAVGLSE